MQLVCTLLILGACGDSTGTGATTFSDTTGDAPVGTTATMVSDGSVDTGSVDTGSETSSSTSAGTRTGSGSETGSSGDTGRPGGRLAGKDDVYATGEGVELDVPAGGVLDNDTGSTLSVADFDAVSVEGGSVEISGDGALHYAPPANFWGWDQFGYTVQSGDSSAAALVRVFVEPSTILLSRLGPGTPGGFAIDGSYEEHGAATIAGAGDFNGDGLHDLVVGAWLADPLGIVDAGMGYAVYGKSDPTAVGLSDLEGAMPAGGVAIVGSGAGSLVGVHVSGSGDINGDGFADVVVVGSPGPPDAPVRAGQVYVVFGKADTAVVEVSELGGDAPAGGFVIRGTIPWGDAGFAVSAESDVNGDGLDDIIIGAPGFAAFLGEDPDVSRGRVYVVFGKADSAPVELGERELDPPSAGFAIVGANQDDEAGSDVSAAGDVNGDGLGDFVVGAPRTGSNVGTAYVVFGTPDTVAIDLADVDAGTSSAGYAILGRSENDRAGGAVGAAGDFDGDGLDDVAVAVSGSSSPLRGGVYIVAGQAGGETVDLLTLGDEGFFIDASGVGGISPSVGDAGDFNGDGLDDLVLGFGSSEEVYILFGRSVPSDIDLVDVRDGAREVGAFAMGEVGSNAGFVVGRAGDVNGDGIGDVAIGGIGDSSFIGQTYVLFGGNFGGHLTCYGSADEEEVLGDEGTDVVATGGGPDHVVSGGGPDVVYSGPGDDLIEIADVAFSRIDGGTGHDVVALLGENLTLDLSSFSAREFANIEVLDLTGRGDNTLVLEVGDIVHASDSSNTLTVEGNTGDELSADLSGAGFSSRPGPVGYTDFTTGIVTLRVADAVDTTLVLL